MVDFSNRLKELRKKNGYSQKQLANRLGVSPALISAYETGSRLPSYDNLLSLANIYHVSTDFLLGRNSNTYLDTSGLSVEEVKALETLIRGMRK